MQSGIASNPIETSFAQIAVGINAPLLRSCGETESGCFDGVCSIDSGFSALLRNSKGKLTVAPAEKARGFDFDSPNLL